MKKIQVSWAGEGFSCFWSKEHGIMGYHPECDLNLLHEEFGGVNYYQSRTGLTGAGYLQLQPEDILIELGYYRVDVWQGSGNQHKKQVGETNYGDPIWGYVPVINGGFPEKIFPIVLTDGDRIMFLSCKDLPNVVENWEEQDWENAKTITAKYYTSEKFQKEEKFKLITNGYYGVNALRFSDLRYAQKCANEILETTTERCEWQNILNVRSINNKIAVIDPLFNYVTHIFEFDNIWPDVINGWVINKEDNSLFCWKRINNSKIKAMSVNLETNEEYEEEFSSWIFDPKNVREQLQKALKRKERRDAVIRKIQNYSEYNIRNILEDNPNLIVSFDDSISVGNCSVGTKNFIERFGLSQSNRFGELIKHDQFNEMLKNVAFRRAVAYTYHKENCNC